MKKLLWQMTSLFSMCGSLTAYVLKMDRLYDMAKVLVIHWIIQLCKVEWRNRLFPISIQIISPPLHH